MHILNYLYVYIENNLRTIRSIDKTNFCRKQAFGPNVIQSQFYLFKPSFHSSILDYKVQKRPKNWPKTRFITHIHLINPTHTIFTNCMLPCLQEIEILTQKGTNLSWPLNPFNPRDMKFSTLYIYSWHIARAEHKPNIYIFIILIYVTYFSL